jgi:hypothetical protein
MQTIDYNHAPTHRVSESPAKAMRALFAQHAQSPLAQVRELMRSHQILCLGEIHNYAGRYMLADMVEAAGSAGASVLFVEVCTSEQQRLDLYMRSGLRADLPESAGGGAEAFDFQQPYVEMLLAARALGMRVVAIDQPYAPINERDAIMAKNVIRFLSKQPHEKVVLVAGQLHLLRRPFLHMEKPLASYLYEQFSGQAVTMGRAFLDPMFPEFSLWAAAACSDQYPPAVLPTEYAPFAQMPGAVGADPLYGSDFDYVFFYPFPERAADQMRPIAGLDIAGLNHSNSLLHCE